ncbi:hypothetical protein D3C78_1490890 [compost metagenome]
MIPLIPTLTSGKESLSAAGFPSTAVAPLFPVSDFGEWFDVTSGEAVGVPADILGPSSFRSSDAEASSFVRLHKLASNLPESSSSLAYA